MKDDAVATRTGPWFNYDYHRKYESVRVQKEISMQGREDQRRGATWLSLITLVGLNEAT